MLKKLIIVATLTATMANANVLTTLVATHVLTGTAIVGQQLQIDKAYKDIKRLDKTQESLSKSLQAQIDLTKQMAELLIKVSK